MEGPVTAGEQREFLMPIVIRALLLYFGGLLVIAATIGVGITIAFFGHLDLIPQGHFWERIRPIPAFEIVGVATMLSMMLPAAYFGVNILASDDEHPTYERGWRQHPEFEVFMLTCFVVMPLLAVFPADESKFSHVFPVSRDEYRWSFITIWWVHGAINAAHVWMLRKRLKDPDPDSDHDAMWQRKPKGT